MTAIGDFILALIASLSSTTFRFRVNREKPFLPLRFSQNHVYPISQLLKVVETCFWVQNDRNRRFYIRTYNKPKLYDLGFSRKSRKTVFVYRDFLSRRKFISQLLKVIET